MLIWTVFSSCSYGQYSHHAHMDSILIMLIWTVILCLCHMGHSGLLKFVMSISHPVDATDATNDIFDFLEQTSLPLLIVDSALS